MISETTVAASPIDMHAPVLSIVIPFYNEAATLQGCVLRVLDVLQAQTTVEILLIDDGSSDGSTAIAESLAQEHPSQVRVLKHSQNCGKGAALHTGFAAAQGDFVGVQDADMEYDPTDLPRLLKPLLEDKADVVFGSRFMTARSRRVMYFWHRQINRALTVLSNMLTDLDLTDMETCYKVFRRDLLQSLSLQEARFGFEPEVVAKVAQKRVRIYEVGISYHARSFSEGKKIRAKDGLRALWCILKYNLPRAAAPLQFAFYLLVGGLSACVNLSAFLALLKANLSVPVSAATAFLLAAAMNYWLSISLLFRRHARWPGMMELAWYSTLVVLVGAVDTLLTSGLVHLGHAPILAKAAATLVCLAMNFFGRKYLVFYERGNPDWQPR